MNEYEISYIQRHRQNEVLLIYLLNVDVKKIIHKLLPLVKKANMFGLVFIWAEFLSVCM